MSRTIARWLAVTVAVACPLLAATATAQEEPGDPEDVPKRADEVIVLPAIELDIAPFVFNNKSVEDVRKRLDAALALDIGRFDQKYGLTPAQKKKLQLAGGHDIRRYLDQVEELRVEYRRVKGDWNLVGDRVIRLQQTANRPHVDLFGDGSMLAKTMRKTLTAEQVARQEKAQYSKKVKWMAEVLCGRLVMSTDQRRQLEDLVVAETPPLKHYGNHDYDAIMFQMSRLPREKLRAFLDDNQCRALAIRFGQARRMEEVLVSEGYLGREKAASGPPVEGPLSRREEARR